MCWLAPVACAAVEALIREAMKARSIHLSCVLPIRRESELGSGMTGHRQTETLVLGAACRRTGWRRRSLHRAPRSLAFILVASAHPRLGLRAGASAHRVVLRVSERGALTTRSAALCGKFTIFQTTACSRRRTGTRPLSRRRAEPRRGSCRTLGGAERHISDVPAVAIARVIQHHLFGGMRYGGNQISGQRR